MSLLSAGSISLDSTFNACFKFVEEFSLYANLYANVKFFYFYILSRCLLAYTYGTFL
jgi:hypothetical protein